MKHCSNCRNCVIDAKALTMGIYIHKCRLGGHSILHPFWSGFKCSRWKKERVMKDG